MLNRESKPPYSRVHLIRDDSTTAITPEEKATTLADHFCPPETCHEEEPSPYDEEIEAAIRNSEVNPLNLPFNATELNNCLNLLKSKAMGPDCVHNEMLGHLSMTNRATLLKILNQLWSSGQVPPDWKKAIIIPIAKPGKSPHLAESYRPISLTSCLGKVMEKMVSNRLTWHLDANNLLPKDQAGFRRGFSTLDHIARLETTITTGFSMKQMTGAVFLDIAKAYDSTWHPGLLVKLARSKITGNSLLWICNLLHNRYAQVRMDGYLSSQRQIREGVPQGSTLSPTLFNIALADFPDPPEGCFLSLYADDVAIYTTATTITLIQIRLQNYLNTIVEWSSRWKFTLSHSKCFSVIFTRRRSPTQLLLELDGAPLQNAGQFKFLGMIFQKDLSWSAHLKEMEVKLQKLHNLFRSMTSSKINLNIQSLAKIYKSFVQSDWITVALY